MSKLLTQDQIAGLILEKEKQDAIFKHNMEVKAEKTQELFLKIKDDFINFAVEISVQMDYVLCETAFDICLCKALNKELGLNLKNLNASSFRNKDNDQFHDIIINYSLPLLRNNLRLLLEKSGWVRDFKYGGSLYTTSKQTLLGGLTIHDNTVVDKQSFTTEQSYNEDETKWVGLFLVVVVVAVVLGFVLL